MTRRLKLNRQSVQALNDLSAHASQQTVTGETCSSSCSSGTCCVDGPRVNAERRRDATRENR